MLAINSLNSFVMDLALVESHFDFNGRPWPGSLRPVISFRNRTIETPQPEGFVAVGVESTITIDEGERVGEERLFACRVIVGCTVAAPKPEDGRRIEEQLVEQAVQTNAGFARTIIYQQTLSSQLPGQLIIPPMSFDGILDE